MLLTRKTLFKVLEFSKINRLVSSVTAFFQFDPGKPSFLFHKIRPAFSNLGFGGENL